MIEIDQKNSDLITNIVSKRLRNSDTFLNGYWDSTIFFNSKAKRPVPPVTTILFL